MGERNGDDVDGEDDDDDGYDDDCVEDDDSDSKYVRAKRLRQWRS